MNPNLWFQFWLSFFYPPRQKGTPRQKVTYVDFRRKVVVKKHEVPK